MKNLEDFLSNLFRRFKNMLFDYTSGTIILVTWLMEFACHWRKCTGKGGQDWSELSMDYGYGPLLCSLFLDIPINQYEKCTTDNNHLYSGELARFWTTALTCMGGSSAHLRDHIMDYNICPVLNARFTSCIPFYASHIWDHIHVLPHVKNRGVQVDVLILQSPL